MKAKWSFWLSHPRKSFPIVLIAGAGFMVANCFAGAETVYVTYYFDYGGGSLGIIQSPGNVGRLYGFNGPSGLAVDDSDSVYVANYNNGTITKVVNPLAPISSPPIYSVFASGLSGPVGLAFDGNGNLFVANNSIGTIDKIDRNGKVSLFASVPWLTEGEPVDLAFDRAGYLYVSTTGSSGGPSCWAGGDLLQFDSNGNEVNEFGLGSTAFTGLAVDKNGNLYAADRDGGTIIKFDVPSLYGLGSPSVFTSGLQYPTGLGIDSSGNLYVATGDSYETIFKVDSGGNKSYFASGYGFPYAVAVQIPEPATWHLLAFGVLTLVGIGRLHRGSP